MIDLGQLAIQHQAIACVNDGLTSISLYIDGIDREIQQIHFIQLSKKGNFWVQAPIG